MERMDAETMTGLAKDIVAGRIAGSWMTPDDPLLMFMICKLGGVPEDAGAVYEYLSEAGPLAVNDYPTFMSARFIHRDDLIPLQEKCHAVQAALDGVE